LQLADMLLLILLRRSQNTTSSECIERPILGSYALFRFKILSLILTYALQLFESNAAGQNQSICKGQQIKGSIRLVVLVERRPVITKELVEVNQYEMDSNSKLDTVRFVHYQIQYHQYKIGANDKTKKSKIRYQTAL
jgi:hypothetical protein